MKCSWFNSIIKLYSNYIINDRPHNRLITNSLDEGLEGEGREKRVVLLTTSNHLK